MYSIFEHYRIIRKPDKKGGDIHLFSEIWLNLFTVIEETKNRYIFYIRKLIFKRQYFLYICCC